MASDEIMSFRISATGDTSFNDASFPKNLPIPDLKEKLQVITGISSSAMDIQVYNENGILVCFLSDDAEVIGSYPVEPGMRMHVEVDCADEWMSASSDDEGVAVAISPLYEDEQDERIIEDAFFDLVTVGSRCLVKLPSERSKIGIVLYKGFVEGLPGRWIGVQYDQRVGENDGTLLGKRYFTCPPKFGGFVRPHYVVVNDNPEDLLGI